ncbi:coiled-coil domain-containing protein 191-like [Saccoglossus kowalevskii]
MEERAARIAQRKTEAERRKRQREDEKLARIREEEAKRLAEEEEERKTKLERIREERRLAKQRELEKQQRLEYINRQNNKADEHYRQTLLRNKGIKPWIKLINISKQNMQVAVDHCNTQLLCRCFMPWKDIAQEIVREKEMMADELYKYILARRAFSSWRKYGHLQSIQLQKARRHFAYTATVKYFKLWQDFVTEERVEFMRKDEMAMDHSEYRIMKTAFITWREYPKTIKLLREKEKRRSEMRKKVQSLLPDFGS